MWYQKIDHLCQDHLSLLLVVYTAVFRVLTTGTYSGTYLWTLSMLPNASGPIWVGEGSPELTDVVAVVFPEMEPPGPPMTPTPWSITLSRCDRFFIEP